MKVGFLHLGSPRHGIHRYGRTIAAAVARVPEVEAVLEEQIELAGDLRTDVDRLGAAARALSRADLIHVQLSARMVGAVWGNGPRQLAHLGTFLRAVKAPLVVTVHDLREPPTARVLREVVTSMRGDTLKGRAMGLARAGLRASNLERTPLRLAARRADRVVVCTAEEARRFRLQCPGQAERVTVIPHFVEQLRLPDRAGDVREQLGLRGARVVTLLGYIHERKGHRLVVEAMSRLPADVIVVFAGSAARDWVWFERDLRSLAARTGVIERLRITGYIEEDELHRYLAVTDLALCPFETFSASGSLSTWIAAGRPILVSDQPQIAEYDALAPGALRRFAPYRAEALAEAITAALDDDPDPRASDSLRAQLSLERIAARHVEVYAGVVRRA